MMRKRFFLLPAALVGMMLMLLLLYAVVMGAALRVDAYPQEPPFGAMAEELVAYLRGDLPELSPALFTERERLHMVDVLGLFEGAERIARFCGASVPIFLTGAIAFGGRRRAGSGLLIGFGLFAGFAAFLGVWAAVDFNGWFTALHEMVFTNDLWLLDPADSMLINMLPTEFFMAIIGRIGLWFTIGAALLVAGAVILRRLNGRKRES